MNGDKKMVNAMRPWVVGQGALCAKYAVPHGSKEGDVAVVQVDVSNERAVQGAERGDGVADSAEDQVVWQRGITLVCRDVELLSRENGGCGDVEHAPVIAWGEPRMGGAALGKSRVLREGAYERSKGVRRGAKL